MKNFLSTFGKVAATCTLGLALNDDLAAASPSQPNVVIVYMDNFGWGEPGFNGGGITRGAPTPNLDSIAAEGMKLTNFNVEAQCTPSRSALMTGRYAVRSGTTSVPLDGGVYGLVDWEVTMAEMFADAGYSTAMFGKWHLGDSEGRYPTDQGFDEWYGIPNSSDESAYTSLDDGFKKSGIHETYIMEGEKGKTPKKIKPYNLEERALIDEELTERAMEFMEEKAKADEPFFLYLPYTATHYPSLPNPKFKGSTGNGNWADLLHQVDTYNGMLLDKIEELGIEEDTIFIFTADNGPEAVDPGSDNLSIKPASQGSPGPWRGTLFTGFEGSLRVPFAAKWPGKIPAGTSSNEIVHAMDLFPTLAKIVGGKVPQDRPIDGIDMSDFFLGKKKESGREDVVVYMGSSLWGLKWNNWKINFKEQDGVFSETKSYGMPKVYNLYNDPQERENVLFPHTWVPKAAFPYLKKHKASLMKYPPIKPGTPDPYIPPKDAKE